MDLSFNPIISYWFVLAGLVIGLATILIRVDQWRLIVPLCLFVVVLGGFGLRPTLTTTSKRPPERPVKVIFEPQTPATSYDFSEARERMRSALNNSQYDIDVTWQKMDQRWETAPVFVDYHTLYDRISAVDPVQVIIGRGNHTSPRSVPIKNRVAPSYRAVWNPGDETSSETSYLRVDRPVKQVPSNEKPGWSVQVQGADQLQNPELVLKSDGSSVYRRQVSGDPSQRLTVTVNRPGTEQSFFVLQLLGESETSLPQGHPRRQSLGLITSQGTKKALVRARSPTWETGWWSRVLKSMDQWTVQYDYSDQPAQLSERPNLIIQYGLLGDNPTVTKSDKRDAGGPSQAIISILPADLSVAKSSIPGAWLNNGAGELSDQAGGFEVGLDRAAATELAPGLLRFGQSFSSAPMLSHRRMGLKPDDYQSLVKVGGHGLIFIHETAPRLLVTRPSIHVLSMRWGSRGMEKTASGMARELIRAVSSRSRSETRTITEKNWAEAGEPVRLSVDGAEQLHVSGQWNNSWDKEIPEHLIFPRPGQYELELKQAGETLSDHINIVESDRSRLPEAGQTVPNLVNDDRVFTGARELVDWIGKQWENQQVKRSTVIWSWNSPFNALLGLGLLLVYWWYHDRSGF